MKNPITAKLIVTNGSTAVVQKATQSLLVRFIAATRNLEARRIGKGESTEDIEEFLDVADRAEITVSAITEDHRARR